MEVILTKNYVLNLNKQSPICGVYKIKSPSGKIYIGQTVNIRRRLLTYFRPKSYKSQIRLINSFTKYSVENHLIEIIEECKENLLNERERYWQDYYDCMGENGLNCKLTTSSDKSGKLSQKTKILIGLKTKNTTKTCKSIMKKVYQYDSNGNFIREWESLREASRNLNIKTSHISESISDKKPFTLSAGGFIWSFDKQSKIEKRIGKATKKIVQYDLNGNLIKIWNSIKQAVRETKSSKSSIIRCCKNKQKTCNNFIWKYLEN